MTTTLHAQAAIGLVRSLGYEWDEKNSVWLKPDGWIKWGGGVEPIDSECRVMVRYRNGLTSEGRVGDLYWKHDNNSGDIVAYQLLQDLPSKVHIADQKATKDCSDTVTITGRLPPGTILVVPTSQREPASSGTSWGEFRVMVKHHLGLSTMSVYGTQAETKAARDALERVLDDISHEEWIHDKSSVIRRALDAARRGVQHQALIQILEDGR